MCGEGKAKETKAKENPRKRGGQRRNLSNQNMYGVGTTFLPLKVLYIILVDFAVWERQALTCKYLKMTSRLTFFRFSSSCGLADMRTMTSMASVNGVSRLAVYKMPLQGKGTHNRSCLVSPRQCPISEISTSLACGAQTSSCSNFIFKAPFSPCPTAASPHRKRQSLAIQKVNGDCHLLRRQRQDIFTPGRVKISSLSCLFPPFPLSVLPFLRRSLLSISVLSNPATTLLVVHTGPVLR